MKVYLNLTYQVLYNPVGVDYELIKALLHIHSDLLTYGSIKQRNMVIDHQSLCLFR